MENEKDPCPFCAEPILRDAVLCRFCQSKLIGADGRRISASDAASLSRTPIGNPDDCTLWQAMWANALCPGYGAWKLGQKKRGGILLVLIMICVIQYAVAYVEVVKAEMPKAMKTGKTKVLEKRMTDLSDNWWGTAAFWLYLFSFVDVYLVARKKRNS